MSHIFGWTPGGDLLREISNPEGVEGPRTKDVF